MTYPDFFALEDVPNAPRMSHRQAVVKADQVNLANQLDHSRRILWACELLPVDAYHARDAGGRLVLGALQHIGRVLVHKATMGDLLSEAPHVCDLADRAREFIQ